MNKTVNCEIYHGNSKDKIDCPQKVNQINKKELVYSVLLEPHMTLNVSSDSQKKKQQKIDQRKKAKDDFPRFKGNTLTHNSNMVYWNSEEMHNEHDNEELMHIIGNIPEIDIS